MKIIEKSEQYWMTAGCNSLKRILKSPPNKADDGPFYLINFHPSGEPETFICCVIKGAA